MVTDTPSTRPKSRLNPLRIVSSSMYLVCGMFWAVSLPLVIDWHSNGINWHTEAGQSAYVFLNQINLVVSIATPFIAFAVAIVGLLSRKRWIQPAFGAGLFLFSFVFAWILSFQLHEVVMFFTPSPEINQYGHIGDSLLGQISLVLVVTALALSILASALAPKPQKPIAHQIQAEDSVIASQKNQAIVVESSQTSTQNNLNNLPLFALIGAFVIPLAGIILGHLSLNYMKKGQLSTQNKGMATAGLILGYVFVGLSLLVGLILFIVLIVSTATGF